jgi:hypothetical protein
VSVEAVIQLYLPKAAVVFEEVLVVFEETK